MPGHCPLLAPQNYHKLRRLSEIQSQGGVSGTPKVLQPARLSHTILLVKEISGWERNKTALLL